MAKKHMEKWFIDQRLRSLATVVLTERSDLLIEEAEDDGPIDLRVTIRAKKKVPERTFGVILKSSLADLPAEKANALLNPTLEALGTLAFAHPVCLFLFRMVADRGFFSWVAEPVVTADGNPVLQRWTEAKCADLDTSAVHEIVGSVNRWYDAFLKSVMESTKTQRKLSGVEVLHGIIDGEAAFFSSHGKAPRVLKLPVIQAYELAKLGREHLGDLAGHIIKDGVRVLEKEGLLGMKVRLVTDQPDYSFE
jgi:hypothetical protein